MESQKCLYIAKMHMYSPLRVFFFQTMVEKYLLFKLFHCFTEEVLITWLQA